MISRANSKETLFEELDSFNQSKTQVLSESIYLTDDYMRAEVPLAQRLEGGEWITLENITVNDESKIVSIRDVDDKMQTVTFDISVHLQWRDDRIKAKPSPSSLDGLGNWHILDSNHIKAIWHPDLTIYNMSNFRRLSILDPTNGFLKIHEHAYCPQILVDYTFNAEVTVYCDFDFTKYPLDEQICELRMGSISHGRQLKFVLWSREPGIACNRTAPKEPGTYSEEPPEKYKGKGLIMSIRQFTDNFCGFTEALARSERCRAEHLQHVVFDIHMKRYFQPFFMHYYAPSILIVLVMQTSFIIPPECIPGRVALLVTLFLTLVNIFIDQQVTLFRIT